MTGLDRLRGYARRMDELSVWPGGAKLLDIAEQIEREHDAEVANSPYDAILPEDRDAVAWVRDHGGLERVKWLLDWCLSHDSKIEQLDFDFWLSGRVMHELGFEGDMADRDEVERRLAARLMPEGFEWPRHESGEQVRIGDEFIDHEGLLRKVERIVLMGDGYLLVSKTGTYYLRRYGERVKRPQVLAADGEPLEAGQTVWHRGGNAHGVVESIDAGSLMRTVRYRGEDGTEYRDAAKDLTHQRPVLDADGVPIHEGDTVYGTVHGGPFIVTEVSDKGSVFVDAFPDTGMHGSMLTHTKPEPPDSWERIEEDADALVDAEINGEGSCNAANAYCERRGLGEGTSFVLMAQDLVRRCRALAERERGE